MSKLILLSVIAVSVGAQFVSERRPYEQENLRVAGHGLRVNQEYQQEGLRISHRNPEHRKVGGFQNGHYAQNDGRLRTNLDSRIVSEGSGQNFQPRDSLFVVEEGAAFRRQENDQYDVHSSLGRNVDVSYAATGSNNSNERTQIQNLGSQQNGERIGPTNNFNVNGQSGLMYIGQNAGEQAHARDVTSNTQVKNRQGNGNNDRKRNFDQTTGPNVQNIDSNTPNDRNNNQYTFKTQQTSNQESRPQNEDHTNSRQSGQNINTQYDARNTDQNRFNNQNIQQTTERNQNRGVLRNSEKPVSNVPSSRANADKVTNRQNNNRDALDRELNNQITKMIFDESTLEVTPKSYTKTTEDNELPSRSSSGKKDDKWIWGDGNGINNVTTTTIIPTVDDRAAFAGDQCPTGQVRFNNVCVDVD